MNIGIDVSCWPNKRGYGRYTRELLRALLDLDSYNHYWLFLDSHTAHHSPDLPAGERVHHIVTPTTQAAAKGATAAGHRSPWDMWTLCRAVHQYARVLDLFYFPSVYTFFPVWGLSNVVLTIHDAIPEHFPHYIFPSWRNRLLWGIKVRWAIQQAHVITTVSQQARRDIVQAFGLAESEVHVVPDAVTPEFRRLDDLRPSQTVLARYGLGGLRFILYVGGLSPHKNLSILIEAYTSLIEQAPYQDVRLALVGDFQHDVFFSSYPALKKRIERLGLHQRVLMPGFVPDGDLVHVYNAASVFVLPSLDEGFGLPALEAMACGAPVIASRMGALPEVVGDAGLFFDAYDPGELTLCLSQILDNLVLRQALSSKGMLRAQQFSWGRSAQAALTVFKTRRGNRYHATEVHR